MKFDCRVKEVASQPVMSIRGQTSQDSLSATIGEFLGEVWGYVQEAGGQPVGMPFTRIHSVTGNLVELEAGMPVAAPLPARGRIGAGALPGGLAVSTDHFGSYETLQEARQALEEWAAASRYEKAGACWEIYWTDPAAEPDPSKWRTEVVAPLKQP